ncbi:MAG: GFA family protein [Bryobacteraceae bacterium]|nr:GFA family protein [Polyangiaceae bacterium]NUN01641.1 GFA family protein [Bryobacteraceae bacterium]
MSEPDWHAGGCHCGAVRFRVAVRDYQAVDCNCSICRMKGFLHLIVPPGDFELSSGGESLSEYRFNTGVATHRFCKTCGVHPFYTPRSHPDQVDVNVRCLDPAVHARFRITGFDGENWEENVGKLA